jgi:hypothetical protein
MKGRGERKPGDADGRRSLPLVARLADLGITIEGVFGRDRRFELLAEMQARHNGCSDGGLNHDRANPEKARRVFVGRECGGVEGLKL